MSRSKGTLLCLTDEITGKKFGFRFWHIGHLEPRAFYYRLSVQIELERRYAAVKRATGEKNTETRKTHIKVLNKLMLIRQNVYRTLPLTLPHVFCIEVYGV